MGKYKIAIISALIGSFEKPELTITPECQKEFDEYGIDIYRFNDNDLAQIKEISIPKFQKEDIYHETKYMKIRSWFSLLYNNRQKSYPKEVNTRNRLLAKIPRMLFFKLLPTDYDYYIWMDSKFTIQKGWLEYILEIINKKKDMELISYAHSERTSIQQEFNYMKYHMKRNNVKTLLARYNLSEMYNQVYFYKKDKKFHDCLLFETGNMIYSSEILNKKDFLEEWYAHNYYLSIQDQLSFPYLLTKHDIKVGTINQSIFETGFTSYKYY